LGTDSSVSRYSRFRREREKDNWLDNNGEDDEDDDQEIYDPNEKQTMLQSFLIKEFARDKDV
jgi:hypothetical protein